jgi:hypothetical protein
MNRLATDEQSVNNPASDASAKRPHLKGFYTELPRLGREAILCALNEYIRKAVRWVGTKR